MTGRFTGKKVEEAWDRVNHGKTWSGREQTLRAR